MGITFPPQSLLPQGHLGIDVPRAPSRRPGRGQAHRGEQRRQRQEGRGIVRSDAVEQARQDARQAERRCHADRQAGGSEIGEAEFAQAVEDLAAGFVAILGAPDLSAARGAARAEAEYAAGLCEHEAHTLLALERGLGDEGIVERFRVIVPERARDHAKIWEIVPDGDDTQG